ncbi:hypothetical protein [Ornithinimicrobium panacihumi]|uniref:hypothetical protein n=1 Tax=Ornithinimicrobium panacihumi TaxID=2008449 RepID=UPI003F896B12
MRTLAITQNMTLDGRIEMLGEWFDPGDQDPDLIAATSALAEREEILLLGRDGAQVNLPSSAH